MREDGYREAMVGNISLYDVTGTRQHTVYIGEAPEYGKGTFFSVWKKKLLPSKNTIPMPCIYVLRMVQKIIGRF